MTVSQMRRDGWHVCARCPRCHLDCWVDLSVVIRLSGQNVKLWNARTRCRRYGCTGKMIFLCTPPGEALGAFWALADDRGSSSGRA
ncbi:MAG: hypothetical protein WC563_13490 [Brevundimonas sp.]